MILLYSKELKIENPKKFQRQISDITNKILFERDYYLSKKHSSKPYLKSNGIENTADFHGKLCYVIHHEDYHQTLRIIGIILVMSGSIMLISNISPALYHGAYVVTSIIMIVSGAALIYIKFDKPICIKIELFGESYRTNSLTDKNFKEYLNVHSHARLTLRGEALNPKHTLTQRNKERINFDAAEVTDKLTPFLEEYLAK